MSEFAMSEIVMSEIVMSEIVMSDPNPSAAADPDAPTGARKLVIFADGTGNNFAVQESNVWRLYAALDKTEDAGRTPAPLQLARYVPGVGTSGNRVLRAIDGATGIGVPSNVRKLYRFLCWNWQRGDEIYLFGFSRGAFTVRTLASMLRYQGLMPARVNGVTVTEAEMNRNVRRAWEQYRAATAPLVQDGRLQMAPWIGALRWLRDRGIAAKRSVFGQPSHAKVLDDRDAWLRPALGAATPPGQEGGEVAIRYMGLFDTVEAYGFPFEFLRKVWSGCIWPIIFRNRMGARIVARVDQVLALDDERLTFHPIRFDQTGAGTDANPPLIRERWFAGVHSDVGGGYPDDAVAMDPLLWIMTAVEAEGLRFDPAEKARFEAARYPRAVIHDSRAGLAATYRYTPRPKRGGVAEGGAPVLHRSVLTKMRTGADGYAPLLLPSEVQLCDGPVPGTCGPAPIRQDNDNDRAVRRLVRRAVVVNRGQILVAMLFLVLPLIGLVKPPLLATLWSGGAVAVKAWMSAFALNLGPVLALYREVWPVAVGLLALFAGLWVWAGSLQGRIKDAALTVFAFTD
jgi:uncharacterized protein (DUF2235 family)